MFIRWQIKVSASKQLHTHFNFRLDTKTEDSLHKANQVKTIRALRGRKKTGMTTNELMQLLRAS